MEHVKRKAAFHDLKLLASHFDYLILLFIVFFQGIISGFIAPVFPLWLKNRYNVETSELFYVLALSGIGTALLNLIAGRISDKVGDRKRYFQITIVLAFLRSLLFAFQPDILLVIIVNWFTQISTSAVVFSLVSDKIKANPIDVKPGLINSIVRVSVAVGMALGQPLGLMTFGKLTSPHFFILYCLFFAVLFLIVTLKLKNEARPVRIDKSVKQLKKGTPIFVTVAIFLIVSLIYCGNQSINTILVLHVSDKFSNQTLGSLLSFTVIGETICYLFAGKLLDKCGITKSLAIGIFCGCTYYTLLAFSNDLWQLYALQCVYVVQISIVFMSLMSYVQKLFQTEIGYANSVFFSSLIIASTTSNFYVGLMSRFGTKTLLLSFAILMILGMLSLLVFCKYQLNKE
jgi:MFS family permease